MSSDTESEMCSSPDIFNSTTTASNNSLLTEKSRIKYEKAYSDFMEWTMNNTGTCASASTMSEDLLLAYFEDMSKKFNSSTLWTYYSMLKNTLNVKHKVDLAKYCSLTAFLKGKSKGYKAKKAKIFTPEEINKFLNEAPDKLYLQSKVGLIFGILGACRRQELYNLQFSDVKVFDKIIIVTIPNTKTRTSRTFTITGSYSKLCKSYIDLRPSECSEPGFFLHYSAGKCSTQKVGINKFGGLGKTIAEFLNLPRPEMYTGHCFRRTSAALLVDADGDGTTLRRRGDWSSTTVPEGVIEEKIEVEVDVPKHIIPIKSIENKETVNINLNMPIMAETSQQDPLSTTIQCGQLHISHCSTVNVYKCYHK